MAPSPSRRQLLASSGMLFAWTCLPKLAQAEGREPRLLAVILRGGLKGLLRDHLRVDERVLVENVFRAAPT